MSVPRLVWRDGDIMRRKWQANLLERPIHRAVHGIPIWLGYLAVRSAWVPKTFIPKSGRFTK